jgi:hypothetical protein
MNSTKESSGWTIGRTSLSLLIISTIGFILTAALTYIPRDNDYRAILTLLGLLIGFAELLIGIPLLIAAFVTSVIAVVKKRGLIEGRITLFTITGMFLAYFLWLFLK